MKHIGFTGTRRGMTPPQMAMVNMVLTDLVRSWPRAPLIAHHGDCVGADAEFHGFCEERGFRLVGHVPSCDSQRAFCKFDEVLAPLAYMARNRAIVTASDYMIATPAEETEQQRGGTWATIRMARKTGRPLALCLPSGRVAWERWP